MEDAIVSNKKQTNMYLYILINKGVVRWERLGLKRFLVIWAMDQEKK